MHIFSKPRVTFLELVLRMIELVLRVGVRQFQHLPKKRRRHYLRQSNEEKREGHEKVAVCDDGSFIQGHEEE